MYAVFMIFMCLSIYIIGVFCQLCDCVKPDENQSPSPEDLSHKTLRSRLFSHDFGKEKHQKHQKPLGEMELMITCIL